MNLYTCHCGCGRQFVQNACNHFYVSLNCKSRAERARRKAREQQIVGAVNGAEHVGIVMNPTDEVLNLHAQGYLSNPMAKPVRVLGSYNTKFQPPEGVLFGEQADGGHIMGHEKVILGN